MKNCKIITQKHPPQPIIRVGPWLDMLSEREILREMHVSIVLVLNVATNMFTHSLDYPKGPEIFFCNQYPLQWVK